MAAPAPTTVFERGDRVVDYWLTRSEGFAVEPLGGHVEEVRLAPGSGRAAALVVRTRLGRTRVLDPGAVASLDPTRRVLVVATGPGARARAARHARSAAAWTSPRVARGARTAGARTAAGAAWLAPRFLHAVAVTAVTLARLVVAGARTLALIAFLLGREAVHVAAGLRTRAGGIKRPWDSPSV